MKGLIAACLALSISLVFSSLAGHWRINNLQEKLTKSEQKFEEAKKDFDKRLSDLNSELDLERQRTDLALQCDSSIYQSEKLHEAACLEIHFLPSVIEEDPEKKKKNKEQEKELDAILNHTKFIIEVLQGVKTSLAILPSLTPILKNTVEVFNEELEKCQKSFREYREKYRPQK